MIIKNDESKFVTWPDVALALSAICTLSILSWVLWSCRHGIDFADEGFYLVWISNPSKYSASVWQFGFIYHPLYELLQGNIAALRQSNILITFFLAWILTNLTLRSLFQRESLERVSRYVISAAFATACLVFLRLWIPTPSYNWLAFQALMISAIGLLLIEKNDSTKSIVGCVLLGVGGWLAFMAKPTTAAALGFFSFLYLLTSGKFSIRTLIISLSTALGFLFLSALIIDGSLLKFIDRLDGSFKLMELADTSHKISGIFRLDSFQFDVDGNITLVFCIIIFFIAPYFSVSKDKASAYAGRALTIIFSLPILAVAFGYYHQKLQAGEPFQPLLLWSIPLSTILVGVSLYKFGGLRQISRSHWVLALTFFIFPYAFAFGTSNNYWFMGGLVSIFWVLAGLVFLSPLASSRNITLLLLPLCFAAQLMTVVQVLSGVEGPYYQPQPLRQDDYKVELGVKKTTLRIPQSFGRYITDAIKVANQAGFKANTPMIDLTGHSPGVLFSLGASNTGEAWIYGNFPNNSGYLGGDKVAAEILKNVPCEEAARAWILAEPTGPVHISTKVLSSFGANFDADFEVVGTFDTAKYVGGFPRIQTQEILKPTRPLDVAMTACALSRASHP